MVMAKEISDLDRNGVATRTIVVAPHFSEFISTYV